MLYMDYRQIPIYITVRDRVSDLTRLVTWLEQAGSQRIVLLDNASTYEPCTEYLRHTPHIVERLPNYGSRSIWRANLVPLDQYFVLTDPDVVPINACPNDLVERLYYLLTRRDYTKAGAGLYLDDVPTTLPSYQWEQELVADRRRIWPGAYDSLVDTTFALYRPNSDFCYEAIRSGYPYQLRHSSWYTQSDELSDEDRYYLEHANTGSTGSSWKETI